MSLPSPDGEQSAWVSSGDYQLNFAGISGAPTLRPSPDLEQRLALPIIPIPPKPNPTGIRIGIHVHAYHLPELHRILDQLHRAVLNVDLLITTDNNIKASAIEAQLAQYPSPPWQQRLELKVVPNCGRNLIPLLREGLPFLKPCQAALHLHTKRTTHKTFGCAWFTELLNQLVGDATVIHSILEAFASQPDLGLAMPQSSALTRPYLNWGANFEIASVLAKSLWPDRELSIQAPLVFPAGMMFWFRPQALQPLASALDLLQPLPVEPQLHDGTPLHALERLTAHACELANLRWALIPKSNQTHTQQASTLNAQELSVWQPQAEAYIAGVAALAAQHRQLLNKLGEQTATIKRQEAAIKRQEADISAIDKHRQSLEASLQERDQGLRHRDAALADAAATVRTLENEVYALRQSLSWRVTGPLRRMRRLLQ